MSIIIIELCLFRSMKKKHFDKIYANALVKLKLQI